MLSIVSHIALKSRRTDKSGRWTRMRLDPIKVTSGILVVHVSFLNLLGQLAFALPGLLRALQFKTVLVHREPHGLFKLKTDVSQCTMT